MTEDSALVALVAAVWIALAALYVFVPMFDMPGSALVWGSGAVLFAVLAAAIARAERREHR